MPEQTDYALDAYRDMYYDICEKYQGGLWMWENMLYVKWRCVTLMTQQNLPG